MFEGLDQQEADSGDENSEDSQVNLDASPVDLLESTQKRKFSGWGSYTREFKNICEALAADGRDLQLKQIADRFLVRESTCPGCYPLMKILSRTCAPKKSLAAKKSKKTSQPAEDSEEVEQSPAALPEPTPPKLLLQREPGMKIEIYLEALLTRLAEDRPRREEGLIAIKKLSDRLLSKDYQQLPGERDYFAAVQNSLNQFLEEQDLFKKKEQAKAESETGVHVGSAPGDSVDDLFNYD